MNAFSLLEGIATLELSRLWRYTAPDPSPSWSDTGMDRAVQPRPRHPAHLSPPGAYEETARQAFLRASKTGI